MFTRLFENDPPDTDAIYMQAVRTGDIATAQRMVKEAAKRAGIKRGRLSLIHAQPDDDSIRSKVEGMAQSYRDCSEYDEVFMDTHGRGFSTSGDDSYRIDDDIIDSGDARDVVHWTFPFSWRIIEYHNSTKTILTSDLQDASYIVPSDVIVFDKNNKIIPLSKRF